MRLAEERAQIKQAIGLHREVTGARPTGWYTGRSSMNTLRLTAEAGFDWISDAYDDDLPYWLKVGARHQLVIPYTLDANDMRFATAQGFNTGEHFYQYLKDALDCLLAEGAAGRAKMMSVGLHCRLIGRPGRAMGLARFLDYARKQKVWFATRREIAAHWTKHHPPLPRLRPSAMDQKAFVAAYGGIFEHSPWVAARAYKLELGPAHDSAMGLSNALARAFRAASANERMGVLKAHPDLAGKLARAKRLTRESAAEQAGAGLDALTDAERRTFEKLNADYVKKHGFAFIIAVRDHNKAAILKAFKTRLANDTETEFAEACAQVERIALHRLKDLLP